MIDFEKEKKRRHPRQNKFDFPIALAEVVYGTVHFTSVGLPIAAWQVGGDQALDAAERTSVAMARARLPDTMPVVLQEVEAVKAITGMDSGSAISTVFIFAALVAADGIRRTRRVFSQK